MRLCTLRINGEEAAAVVTPQGVIPVKRINAHLGRCWPTDVLTLLQRGFSPMLMRDAERTPGALQPQDVRFGPLYRHPRKIWASASTTRTMRPTYPLHSRRSRRHS
jgi:hypothetical protein